MGQTLRAVAKQAARLTLIELLVPGGTLIVLSILLANRIPAISDRFAAPSHSLALSYASGRQHDLVSYSGLRRIR